ncbi:hypothetical protein EJ08DRAFT_634365 [Tothia fuscella]|uniref:PH domain-containing protein n=1 Tax=Tothia fuscella TaxID=1048955 RepID=A0A9P4NR69_9PEZI|nr:hypothetical protein EJ08DRAFT_634365 [Tothia fuscella]
MEPPNLDPNSHTYQRLQHATPEHLYLTSRRCFIGPIPEGWLKSHRKSWYGQHLSSTYSSKAATFSANENVSNQRRITGLKEHGRQKPSFKRPVDVDEIEDEGEDDDLEEDATREVPRINVDNAEEEHPRTTDDTKRGRRKSRSGPSKGSSLGRSTAKPKERGMLSPAVSTVAEEDSSLSIEGLDGANQGNRLSLAESHQSRNGGALSSTGSEFTGAHASTSSLIRRDAKSQEEESQERAYNLPIPPAGTTHDGSADHPVAPISSSTRKKSIHFNVPEDSTRGNLLSKARMAQIELRRPMSKLKRRGTLDGQIIKMERMLVRLDATVEKKLPNDFDENSSQGVITSTLEKWREYMVVCRKTTNNDEAEFVLQIYKTRVIPAVENASTKKRASREILIGKKHSNVNLFSPLDKTVVVWTPEKRGTHILLLRPRTNANGVEWYAFIRNILGWQHSDEIQVNVPHVGVSLRIEDPFSEKDFEPESETDAQTAAQAAIEREQVVARDIINRSLAMLQSSPNFTELIDAWTMNQRVGLAWKRYDRLEWIHGQNEKKMYGSMAMIKSHELELRAKEHYPTTVESQKEKELTEPAPVEGFLIRLTSQKGAHQRMGKLFFKRLYFHTHDQFLFFSRPARADPPPPPILPTTASAEVPSAHQIADKTPIIYAVNPYPVNDGEISWLTEGHNGTPEARRRHDDYAFEEMQRKFKNLSDADGFINLCNVVKVRKVHRGATPADDNVDEGSDVDFDMDVSDTMEDDGTTDEFDDQRSFELVLKNGLVIRLQAFDKQTKKEWKKRLRHLIRYWKNRCAADIELLKSVRRQNLEELQIDEETEAIVGQFARKWEVVKSYASPELYNMCGISCCRTIHMSGPLYRKPRLHKLFTALHCVLVPGKLLLYSTTLRSHSGKTIPHIHHEKIDVIDLKEVYLYSGLLTENDLLYQNRSFDSNNPGHNALPRMWLDDQWTSRDEDVMTCFVIWRPLNKGWFRSPGVGHEASGDVENQGTKARLKRVSQLGATGRSIVFKARSRAERDHWVLAIGTEIERLAGGEDVRITTDGSTSES